jgi:HD superfamily phosphohydrolase
MWNIQDPVWGTIEFSGTTESLVKEVFQSKAFQLLRYKSQLGLAQLVFPSANHTRLSHALGTAFLAEKVASKIGLDSSDHKALVASALLHDIGHLPFSHCFLKKLSPDAEKFDVRSDKDWTTALIKSDGELSATLDHHQIRESVLEILKDNHYLSSIISSDVDIDRMDYLTRDAYFTGIPAAVDSSFLIASLEISQSGDKVYFKSSAVNAIEIFLMARYRMYKTVYRHPLVSFYEDQIASIIYRVVKNKHTLKDTSIIPDFLRLLMDTDLSYDQILSNFSNSALTEFDTWVFLKKLTNQTTDTTLGKMADSLIFRRKAEGLENPKIPEFYANTTLVKKDDGSLVDLKDLSEVVKCMSPNNQKELTPFFSLEYMLP